MNTFYVKVGRRGIASRFVKVSSFTEASKVCQAYIKEFALGSSQWRGGTITSSPTSTKVLARVSHNGRVWATNGSLLEETIYAT